MGADGIWREGRYRPLAAPLEGDNPSSVSPLARLWRGARHTPQSLFNGLPACLAAGIGGYFALPIEPAWPVFALAGALAVALAGSSFKAGGACGRAWLAAILAGFVIARLDVDRQAPVVLPANVGAVALSGVVAALEQTRPTAWRMTLDVDRLDRVRQSFRPQRVRLRVGTQATRLAPGDRISVRARLYRLITPVAPGGYDHGRALWLAGIGASGFVLGKVARQTGLAASGYTMRRWLHHVRQAIARRIDAALPADEAAIAKALIIARRGAIAETTRDNLRAAGLAHVLAISGLHMSLVGGGVFWLLRALLALSPGLALRWAIKSWAAAGALAASTAYLLLSGAGTATQRAYVMLAVMLVAVMLNRPALSMRNLAIAALAVIALRPHAVLEAGFQMSFLAVAGLIAVWRALEERRRRHGGVERSSAWPARFASGLVRWIAALLVTSLVALAFTSIPAAYHFNRVAVYSLAGNMAAVPVVGAVIMPAAAIAVALMPLGLEGPALMVMGLGIEWLTRVAETVAAWPHARLALPALPAWVAVVMAAGALWACVWRGPARLGGVAVWIVAALLATPAQRPDILVERAGANVAVRNHAGVLVPASPRRSRYVVEKWLARDGDEATLAKAASRPGWRCAQDVCRAQVKGRSLVYLTRAVGKVACADADIVIARFPLRGACRTAAVRIDRFDVWRSGAHALYVRARPAVDSSSPRSLPAAAVAVTAGRADTPPSRKRPSWVRILTTRSARGDRPWVITPLARRKVVVSAAKRASGGGKTPSANGRRFQ